MDKIFFLLYVLFSFNHFYFLLFVLEKLYRQKKHMCYFLFFVVFYCCEHKDFIFTLEFLVMFILFFGFSYKVFPQKILYRLFYQSCVQQ